jgi:hypothetical protein
VFDGVRCQISRRKSTLHDECGTNLLDKSSSRVTSNAPLCRSSRTFRIDLLCTVEVEEAGDLHTPQQHHHVNVWETPTSSLKILHGFRLSVRWFRYLRPQGAKFTVKRSPTVFQRFLKLYGFETTNLPNNFQQIIRSGTDVTGDCWFMLYSAQ